MTGAFSRPFFFSLLSALCSLLLGSVRARCALAWCLLILVPFWQGPVWEWDAVFNDGEHHLAGHGGCGEDAVLPLAVDADACNLPRYFVLSAPLRLLSGLPRAHGHHVPPVMDQACIAAHAILELPPDPLRRTTSRAQSRCGSQTRRRYQRRRILVLLQNRTRTMMRKMA